MDADLRQRLLDAEGGLLAALSDETLLLPFHSSWSKLEGDLSAMEAQGVVTEDTLALARAVASRISTVVQCYLDIQREQESLRATFASSGKGILAELWQPSTSSASSVQSIDERCSSFVAITSKWLLEHIHNPYPSPQFKTSVAEACGCSQNSVNSWFINARRRIGWTSVCREQFRNCRADAVDAAYRALVQPDPVRPLPAAISEAFTAVKANAEELYSFTTTATTMDSDAVVDDMADYGIQAFIAEGNSQQDWRGGKAAIVLHRQDQHSETTIYPSFSTPPPPVSAIPTLVPSLSDDSDDEDQDLIPPVLAGCKRRGSLPENRCNVVTERPKRLCIRSSPTPSPDASEPPFPSDDEGTMIHASPETRTSCVLPRSRKRRLSEGVQSNISKRPRGLPVTPRPQVVSDPLPRTTISNEFDIDDWFQMNFQTLFELPAPVECSALDSSAQWEVLFGGYPIPSTSPQSEPHLVHSLPRSSEAVLQDVQECGGGFSGFDDLLLPLGYEASANTSPGIQSSAGHFSPEHQFALPDGTPSLGTVPFLDDWVTLCEPTPQTESPGTHASSELNFFELPDLVLRDLGLPVGA